MKPGLSKSLLSRKVVSTLFWRGGSGVMSLENLDNAFAINGKARVVLDRDYVNGTFQATIEWVSNGDANKPPGQRHDPNPETWKWSTLKVVTGSSWEEVFEKL